MEQAGDIVSVAFGVPVVDKETLLVVEGSAWAGLSRG